MLVKILISLILIYVLINIINNKNYDTFTNTDYPNTVSGNSYMKAIPRFDNSLSAEGTRADKEVKFAVERKQDYDQVLKDENADLVYYYNDLIQQDKITEDANDVVNMIDKLDYGNIKTGIQKCEEACDGTCFELGYTGTAACFPRDTKTFFWGSLYKNPTFTYGLVNGTEPYYKYNIQY